ncbi:MAG: HAMP domain-containing histidine kinase [Bacteroidetes bacterium]|nr:HAMP domain-containing histidine kinase [Bacteroidota bacterium]
MIKLTNSKSLFDPNMATLPILIAEWDDSPMDALITYQNNILRNEIGSWVDKSLLELFDKLSGGSGKMVLKKLVNEGVLALPCKIDKMEVKVHSRLGPKHIQITITDNTEINRLRDIGQRSKLIDTFLMIGSHELKTPLNGIIGISSLLKEEEDDYSKSEMLDLIINSGQGLNDVVIKMLNQIYSSKSNSIVNAIVNQNVGDSIMKSLPMFNKYLQDRDFNIENLHLNDKLFIQLPEGNLTDILTEIAINLRRNTPPNGKVTFSTYDEKGEVILIVENEGFGIPETDIKRVFEPFYRHQDKMYHSSGYEYQQAGAGMGLTILKRNVENAGGRVWFENSYPYEQGKQNRVKLYIILPGHNPH